MGNWFDATTAAIRLARAFTNVTLLPLLDIMDGMTGMLIFSRNLGVPKSVEKLTKKFVFNDPESLKYLLTKYHNKFAAVILEPAGLISTSKSLKSIRELCNKHKVILIFDE